MGGDRGKIDEGTIRELRVGDVAVVAEILRQAAEAAPWPESELRGAFYLTGVLAYVTERQDGIAGVVIGRRVGDEGEVLNLAVRPERRRRGEGTRLVSKILEEFADRGVSRVFLEVRESNLGAIGFYERLGFQTAGLRRGYYQNPAEAAKVMELRVNKIHRVPGK
jgi:ribosomal-protein-alanine N-acetyltransferase